MPLKIIILLLYALLALPVSAQTKRALVIGLGQQKDRNWGKINGDKDVGYVRQYLQEANFKNVTTLINRQATKQGISSAFRRLTAACRLGDVVYIHFSGHGQQMLDMHRDETDGLDECWIPYDAYRYACKEDRGEKHLTDDEVNVWLNAIRDKVGDRGRILVVIDACHSGDATRDDGRETTRGVGDIFKAMASLITDAADNGITAADKAVPLPERWITLSACRSDQKNSEMRKPAVGKLTYAIHSILKTRPQCGNVDFLKLIRKFVYANAGKYPQTPVMTGEGVNKYRITDILSK